MANSQGEAVAAYMRDYYRRHSTRRPMIPGGARQSKRCKMCAVEKVRSEYTVRQSGPRSGHLASYCKVCAVERGRLCHQRDPGLYERVERPSKLKRMYGITAFDYDRMLVEQLGGCAICGSTDAKHRKYTRKKVVAFAVDHDHTTGKVRGLLCNHCNRALGLINDNPQVAARMVNYLSR